MDVNLKVVLTPIPGQGQLFLGFRLSDYPPHIHYLDRVFQGSPSVMIDQTFELENEFDLALTENIPRRTMRFESLMAGRRVQKVKLRPLLLAMLPLAREECISS